MTLEPATQKQPIHTTRKNCRACGSTGLTEVLDLGNQALPRFTTEPFTSLPIAPLNLLRCAGCGLLQLQDTVNPDLLFREFWYRSGINQTMRDALEDVVNCGILYHSRGSWLDIGANDGFLLSKVPVSFRKVACEPALNFKPELEELSDEVLADYFSADKLRERFHVITSAAMFYDLDDPAKFVSDIAKSLHDDGVWINQLNDAPTMVKQHAFDAICHEHLCYYDIPSLDLLYRSHGLTIHHISWNEVNGGSVRIVAYKTGCPKYRPTDLLGIPRVSGAEALRFAAWVKRWRSTMGDLIGNLTVHEPLWGYGASTKGCVLTQYLGIGNSLGAIADRNPKKHGLRMVGKWLITNEDVMRKARPRYVLVLPWAFKDEFEAREVQMRENGSTFIYPLNEITLTT